MTKVLAWDEYEAISKENPKPLPDIIEEVTPEEITPLPASSSEKIYSLMFPDNSYNRSHNGQYYVNGEMLEIIEGVIRTDKQEYKDILVSQGFIFMHERDKDPE